MKTKTILFFSMISVFLLIVGIGCEEEARLKTPEEQQLNEQMETRQSGNLAWNYPVKPGTVEWGKLTSYEAQLQAYNIPDDLIKVISTEDLVKVCLAYPEWRLINAYNDRQTGLANLMPLFNGFHELFMRTDAAKELLKIYCKMDPLAIDKNWTALQKGTYSFQFTCTEMLLSHNAIISKLDESDVRLLLDEIVSKYQEKRKLPDIYSLWDLSPTAGLCLNILDRDGEVVKNNSELQSFQRVLMTEDIEILNKIIELSLRK